MTAGFLARMGPSKPRRIFNAEAWICFFSPLFLSASPAVPAKSPSTTMQCSRSIPAATTETSRSIKSVWKRTKLAKRPQRSNSTKQPTPVNTNRLLIPGLGRSHGREHFVLCEDLLCELSESSRELHSEFALRTGTSHLGTVHRWRQTRSPLKPTKSFTSRCRGDQSSTFWTSRARQAPPNSQ